MSDAKSGSGRGAAGRRSASASGRGAGEKGTQGDTRAGGAPGDGAGTPWQPWAEALDELCTALNGAWPCDELTRRSNDAYERLIQATNEVPTAGDLQSRAWEAARDLAGRLAETTRSGVPDASAQQAYADYQERLQEPPIPSDALERLSSAYRELVTVGVDEPFLDGVERRLTEAYEDYLRHVQAAWAAADPETLDVMSLASIGQTLISAASTHTAAVGALAQARLVGSALTAAAPGL
jgi:hypothetical protein